MQKDLFQATPSVLQRVQTVQKQTAFLERCRFSVRLDQAVVCAIGLVVLYAIVFSAGVETGKGIARRELTPTLPEGIASVDAKAGELMNMPAAVTGQPAAQSGDELVRGGVALEPGLRITAEGPAPVEAPSEAKPAGNYTIQILTTTDRTEAERRVKSLDAKGLKAFFAENGKFMVVCVDAFESFQKAKLALKGMKSQGAVPADAYIRSLPKSVA
ncbi:MAG: SPOR domain-containing protein [Candidatus Omnitrophota bacterium]